MPDDDPSIEEQVTSALDAVFGEAEPGLITEISSKEPKPLLEVPELLRTHALYGGS